jgi:hypothetical protein
MTMALAWKTTLFCGSAVWAACAAALAETTPAPSALSPVNPTPVYDPGQLPAYTGRVQQFTLTARGEIDGLILSDGTEVKTPPHLSTAIAYSVKPGETVSVHGLHAAALPLVRAFSITVNGRTIVDTEPAGPRMDPPPPPATPIAGLPKSAAPLPGLIEARGRVRMTLHGPQGEINGALLDDGTVLRLPPPAVTTFSTLLQSGQTVVAEGVGLSNALGKVLDVRQIGTSRENLDNIAVQAPPRGKRPRPPDALAGPPPPPAPPPPAP